MKVGRPTKYRKSFPEKAAKLWSRGATDAEVCKVLKVSHETLSQFEKRHPEFLAAKKASKAIADELVEHALFQRATGLSTPDCHVSTHEGVVTVTPLRRHYAPETLACIYWLKNRKPEVWRDRTELRVEGEIAGMSEEVLSGLRKLALLTMRQVTAGPVALLGNGNGNGNGHAH